MHKFNNSSKDFFLLKIFLTHFNIKTRARSEQKNAKKKFIKFITRSLFIPVELFCINMLFLSHLLSGSRGTCIIDYGGINFTIIITTDCTTI